MKRFFPILLAASAAVASLAAGEPPAAPAAPAAPAVPPSARPRHSIPPEAFTTPTNFVALVSVGGAVPLDWLSSQASEMQRSLMCGFRAFEEEAAAEGGVAASPAAGAAAFFAAHPDARIVVFLADGPGLEPVLASPYGNWAVMDAGWVKRGGGAEELVMDRMGKRVYQTLGALCGAGYRPEPQAVMRYSATPEALDACLSHNFHPLNSNAFSTVAGAVGLDPVRLRPRKELEAEGILQPRGAGK